MKKVLLASVASLAILGLAACGETTEKKEVSKVETEQKEEAAISIGDTTKEQYNPDMKVPAIETEAITARIKTIEKESDPTFDEEKYVITFEVENKRDATTTFQAREVSLDGIMVDDSMITMSQDVSAGKKGYAVLEIQNYEGELPEFKKDLQMTLTAFDTDTFEWEESHVIEADMLQK